MGKGQIARDKQFLLFPQCFLLEQIHVTVSPFFHIFAINLFAVELEEPKIGISGKGLIFFLDFGPKMKKKHCGNIQSLNSIT